jgi:hypothetical protein
MRKALVAGGVTALAVIGAGAAALLLSNRDAPRDDGDSRIDVGEKWSDAVARADPGSTVTVAPGDHGDQRFDGVRVRDVKVVPAPGGTVRLRSLSLHGSGGIDFAEFTVFSPDQGGIRLTGRSGPASFDRFDISVGRHAGLDVSEGSHGVSLSRSRIDATRTDGSTGRGVRLFGDAHDDKQWVSDIEIADNEIFGAYGDLIFIAGARDVVIKGNDLHDPQETSEHNDGVQSVGSDNLLIEGNRIRASGRPGPDQAIIVGHAPTPSKLRVSRTRIVNNIISAWRGSGIIVAGAEETLVAHNTVWGLGAPGEVYAGFIAGRPHGYRNPGLVVVNNVFQKIGDGSRIEVEDHNCVALGGSGRASVRADPRFEDAVEFHLAPSSPCRDMGRPLPEVATDRRGAPRGNPPDAGAWEYA